MGRRDTVTQDLICDHFNKALDDASRQEEDGYLMKDLRAFSVVFV